MWISFRMTLRSFSTAFPGKVEWSSMSESTSIALSACFASTLMWYAVTSELV